MAREVRALYRGRVLGLAGQDAVEEVTAEAFVAWVVPARVPLRPLWARRGRRLAVGNVRLDCPEQVRQWGKTRQPNAASLHLVLDAHEARGERALREMLGDYSVVLYDGQTHAVVVARDPLGIKTLFWGQRPQLLVLSSHLDLVHDTEALDEEFVADFLLGGDPGSERTIWSDSRAVAPGSLIRVDGRRTTQERFWKPSDFIPAASLDPRGQINHFLELFTEGVRARLEENGQTWAELSGGLDSSSVVSLAQMMAERGLIQSGLGGTVSLVDELGEGDERRFSDLVIARFGVRNELIVNPWPWQDDGQPPPRSDEPRAYYPYFARDRLLGDIVRMNGGRALLTGWGSDHYLSGTPLFLSDLVARGHPVRAARRSFDWACARRNSFWRTFAQEALAPLLPRCIQYAFTPAWDTVPVWMRPAFAKRVSLKSRLELSRIGRSARGARFAQQMANQTAEVTRWLPRDHADGRVELRHPFLHRPLVEHSLRLDFDMRIRPTATKWVLRQALKDMLPEPIRTRTGKGGIDARFLWALSKERRRIGDMLAAPILEEHGYVDGRKLRDSVEAARAGGVRQALTLLCVLSLETWLYVRSGRWVVEGARIPVRDWQPPVSGIRDKEVIENDPKELQCTNRC